MNFSGMLLDSDVLAEIRKANPDPAVVAFLRRRSFRHMYISVLSIGELKGLYPYPETDRWITELLERFGDHVIDVDARVSLEWAGRQAPRGQHAVGRDGAGPLPTASLEGLMAASASAYDLELVSSKAQVYRSWGVNASNPWTDH